MFDIFKKTFAKIYYQFTSKINSLFKKEHVDKETIKELEKILLSADIGVPTTRGILNNLIKEIEKGSIKKGTDLQIVLSKELKKLLIDKKYTPDADVYLLVGINGSGKTTFASKLGSYLKKNGKRTLLVAADTFRAAAIEQLDIWGKQINIPVISGKVGQDPASVVYSGCTEFKSGNFDNLIIDTAGRLQTKVNLMKELEKIKNTISKQLPDKKISTLLTIDAMLGQNSFEQAKIFDESTQVDGIVLTKMDGTAKGGTIFSIINHLQIPVAFICFGEQTKDMILFNSNEYINNILQKD